MPGKSGTAIILLTFSQRATSFKTDHSKDSERFRETGTVTHKSRIGRLRKVGQRVQPEDALAHALAHPQSSTREISEHCGITNSIFGLS